MKPAIRVSGHYGIACAVARSRFHLPYNYAKMSVSEGEWIDYESRRPGAGSGARFRYRGAGDPAAAVPGSLEFFLVERYVLFAHDDNSGRIFSGRVHHEPYQIEAAEVEEFDASPSAWNALPAPDGPPDHTCYSRQAIVEVFPLRAG